MLLLDGYLLTFLVYVYLLLDHEFVCTKNYQNIQYNV